MKYVALVYSNPGAFEALSSTERDELMSEADAFLKEFTESGELLSGGVALADPSIGKTVRVRRRRSRPSPTGRSPRPRNSSPATTCVDMREPRARGRDRRRTDPAARFWAVEVRPIMDEAGTEM